MPLTQFHNLNIHNVHEYNKLPVFSVTNFFWTPQAGHISPFIWRYKNVCLFLSNVETPTLSPLRRNIRR